jgi:hypothetical protein
MIARRFTLICLAAALAGTLLASAVADLGRGHRGLAFQSVLH